MRWVVHVSGYCLQPCKAPSKTVVFRPTLSSDVVLLIHRRLPKGRKEMGKHARSMKKSFRGQLSLAAGIAVIATVVAPPAIERVLVSHTENAPLTTASVHTMSH